MTSLAASCPKIDLSWQRLLQLPSPRLTAYRFLKSEDAHFIYKEETLRLTSAQEIRRLELASGGAEVGAGRGDRGELVTSWIPKPGRVRVTEDHPFAQKFKGAHLVDMIIPEEGTQFLFFGHALMLCLTDRADAAMRDRMAAEFDYDAFFYIPDVGRLGNAIVDALGGLKANYGEVWYEDPDTLNPKSIHPEAFRKSTQFSWQRELRLIWPTDNEEPTRTVSIPGLASMVGPLQRF